MCLYTGTNRYFQRVLSKFNLSATLVDATKVENVEKALEEHKDIKVQLVIMLINMYVCRCACPR